MTAPKPPPPAPDTADSDVLAEWAVPHAMLLVGTVHDEGPDATAALLTGLNGHHARALVVALAAMVDPDRTATELLAWTGWQAPPPRIPRPPHHVTAAPDLEANMRAVLAEAPLTGWTLQGLRDAHAAFRRGDRKPQTEEGHRMYERAYSRTSRARRAASRMGQVAA